MPYRLTRQAEADLIAIYVAGFIEFGVPQAENYLDSLTDAFRLLADNPAIARLRREFGPPVRIHPHRAHIIIYQEIGSDILILRVRHGREDWARTD